MRSAFTRGGRLRAVQVALPGGWHSSGLSRPDSRSRKNHILSILSQSSTARSAACISVPPRRHKLARAELYSLRHVRPSRRRQHGVLLFVASRIRPPPLREYASLAQLLRALRLTQLAAVGHVCCLERRCYRANPPPAARVRGERQHTVREARAAAAFRFVQQAREERLLRRQQVVFVLRPLRERAFEKGASPLAARRK